MLKFVFIGLMLCSGMVYSAHITDKLLAGMYATPNAAEQPIQLLPSGTPLELIGEQKGFVKVQLVDGKTGWVEKRFLSDDKPANVRLLALQSKYRQLQEKLDQAEAQLAGVLTNETAEQASSQAQAKVSEQSLQLALADAKAVIERLRLEAAQGDEAQNTPQQAVLATQKDVSLSAYAWGFIVILFMMAIGCGLYMGLRIQDQRQLKKHGGFRIRL
ncbi:MAG: TIGR04211 family SH3 domain-containing protein [Cycloclasticus sp.]|nr:TIGR04211 family SH3 domain-containing protein [Cycloclasticus sp.]